MVDVAVNCCACLITTTNLSKKVIDIENNVGRGADELDDANGDGKSMSRTSSVASIGDVDVIRGCADASEDDDDERDNDDDDDDDDDGLFDMLFCFSNT
jgi:hypothetical protein